MTAGISSIPGKPALIEGVNELEGERLNSPPKLGGVPARPSSSTKGRAGGVVPKQVVARFYLGTTPSAPALVASRHFINGAATPPNLGGEFSRLTIFAHSKKKVLHKGTRLCVLVPYASSVDWADQKVAVVKDGVVICTVTS